MAKSRRNKPSPARYHYSYRYPPSRMRAVSSPVQLSPLRLLPLGDSRLFNPVTRTMRPFAAAPRRAARLVSHGPNAIRFADPRRVLVCLRRKVRREVLNAIGVAGAGGLRRPRRTAASGISCKVI